MKKTYRWGILGPGKIAEKFASALRYTEGAEVFAVASRDWDRANQFAGRYGATRVYDDYRKLAEDPEIDIIYVATPHAFHCEHSVLCLEHQKPVLCEKPLALSTNQVIKMVSKAQQQQTFFMEGMWSRCMPYAKKVMELVNNDVIGPVQYVRADFGFNTPFDPGGRLFNPDLGGGSLLDVGIYPLYLVTMLLGEPSRIQSVGRLSATGADEYCNVQLQYAGGQTANIFSSIVMQTPVTAEIIGTKGRIEIPAPWYKTDRFSVIMGFNESRQEFAFPHEHNGFEHEIREVTACLGNGLTECPVMPHSFSLQLSRIMDTVRKQCGIVYKEDQ